MKPLRSLLLHGSLTLAAAVGAWSVSASPSGPRRMADWLVVWPGEPAEVTAITYRADGLDVSLTAAKDAFGRYWKLDTRTLQDPTEQVPQALAASQVEEVHAISVAGGEELVQLLSPLRAQRAIGRLSAEQQPDFGFDAPAATLTVQLGGQQRVLTFGGKTAGGGDRYGRVEPTGEVYAVSGQVPRMLESAAARLAERQLHGEDLQRARVLRYSAAGVVRTLQRSGPKEEWRRGEDQRVDDVLGNWLNKLQSTNLGDYLADSPAGLQVLARLEYFADGSPVGFVEFAAYDQGEGRQYAVRSERTRRWVTVPTKQGEELEAGSR